MRALKKKFSCKLAWEMWCSCLARWNIAWVMPIEPRSAFESWLDVNMNKKQKKQWRSCSFEVVWSLWDARNQRIFDREVVSITRCKEIFWYR